MRNILIISTFTLLFTPHVLGNNIQVSNVRLTGQNTTEDFTMVEFDISWENSWRYTNGPANWDAAWIFVKYKIGPGPWMHAWLNNSSHVACAGTTIESGLLTPEAPFNISTNPALGVFFFRAVFGTGNISCTDVKLRWNYGANGVSDDAQVDIKVFAIEHVYIPQGTFVVGSGGDETGAFFTYGSPDPYPISSEALINVGITPGDLNYEFTPNGPGDHLGPIPAAYPKGFSAYYAMKYEISQQGYVDFLNTLTRSQQVNRVKANVSGQQASAKFVMSDLNTPHGRNGISCRPVLPPVGGQIEFFCDLNGNNIPHEVNDGQNIPCNWLAYADMAAYLDWAGLRLISEFELEKCGRGKLSAYPNEFAWGDNIYHAHTGLENAGMATEVPNDYASNIAGSISGGPLRVGAFARPGSNRTQSGAGYYGCLDISGSVFERGASVGHPAGRSYTGIHGDGLLTSNGHMNVAAWPASATAEGTFFRCGAYEGGIDRLSDRTYGAYVQSQAGAFYGGRGVRTAP